MSFQPYQRIFRQHRQPSLDRVLVLRLLGKLLQRNQREQHHIRMDALVQVANQIAERCVRQQRQTAGSAHFLHQTAEDDAEIAFALRRSAHRLCDHVDDLQDRVFGWQRTVVQQQHYDAGPHWMIDGNHAQHWFDQLRPAVRMVGDVVQLRHGGWWFGLTERRWKKSFQFVDIEVCGNDSHNTVWLGFPSVDALQFYHYYYYYHHHHRIIAKNHRAFIAEPCTRIAFNCRRITAQLMMRCDVTCILWHCDSQRVSTRRSEANTFCIVCASWPHIRIFRGSCLHNSHTNGT